MKIRIISFLLILLLLPIMVVPASAAYSETCWINLLDYYSGDLQGTSAYMFPLPSGISVYKVDFLVRCSHAPTAAKVDTPGGSVTLTCVYLGNEIYRLFGTLYGHAQSSVVLHTGLENISGSWFSILSAEASMLTTNSFDASANGFVTSSDRSYDISIGSDLSRVFATPTAQDGSDLTFFSDILCSDWEKYDYYVLTLQAYCNDITSISVTHGSDVPSYTISPWENTNLQDNHYIITIRIDLRDVVRNSSDIPCVTICGNLHPISAGVNGFGILRAQGEIVFSDLDPEVHWLKKIWLSITDYFNNLIGTIATWGQNIVSALNPSSDAGQDAAEQGAQQGSTITDLNDQMNNLNKPALEGSGDISGIITPGQLTSYTTVLATVVNAPYISQVVMLSLILSLAAYVLFGKR